MLDTAIKTADVPYGLPSWPEFRTRDAEEAGPMVKVGSICLNATDWKRAAAFWSAALGYTPHPRAADVLVPPDGAGPYLALYQRDRTHLDLSTASRAEREAEVERLVSLGAERVPDWPYPEGADFVVLRDTEGNLFCVVGDG